LQRLSEAFVRDNKRSLHNERTHGPHDSARFLPHVRTPWPQLGLREAHSSTKCTAAVGMSSYSSSHLDGAKSLTTTPTWKHALDDLRVISAQLQVILSDAQPKGIFKHRMAEAGCKMTGFTAEVQYELEHELAKLAVGSIPVAEEELPILLDFAQHARKVDAAIRLTQLALARASPLTSDSAFRGPNPQGAPLWVEHHWPGLPVVSVDEMAYIKSVNSGKLDVGLCTRAHGHNLPFYSAFASQSTCEI
jgi:hypothetical protein